MKTLINCYSTKKSIQRACLKFSKENYEESLANNDSWRENYFLERVMIIDNVFDKLYNSRVIKHIKSDRKLYATDLEDFECEILAEAMECYLDTLNNLCDFALNHNNENLYDYAYNTHDKFKKIIKYLRGAR